MWHMMQSIRFLVHSDNFRVKSTWKQDFNVNNYDTSDSQVVLVQGSVETKKKDKTMIGFV